MENFISVETPQSSVCNLDCVYCYIPKNKKLQNINQKWIPAFRSNLYYEIISETHKSREELKFVSLWGGEPSLGFINLRDLEGFLRAFPNVTGFSTSSNFTNINGFKYIIGVLNKFSIENNRQIKLQIQISIDGPEEINDKNRGKGTYKKIINNILELNKFLNDFKLSELLRIDISVKSTSTENNFKDFAKNKNLLKYFIDSFLKLHEKYAIGLNWPENVDISLISLPTLALPGNYTKEDGKNFAAYYDQLFELNKENNWPNQYSHRLRNLIRESVFIDRFSSNRIFYCSAGDAMKAVDPDGTTHGCHTSFWYNYEDYLTDKKSLSDWYAGKRLEKLDPDTFLNAVKPYMSGFRDSFNENRMFYVLKSFIDNVNHYLNVSYTTIKVLTKAGQINKIYRNESWAKLFAYFITLKSSCWVHNSIKTGSIFGTPLSLYRIYGNGAFEKITKHLYGEIIDGRKPV